MKHAVILHLTVEADTPDDAESIGFGAAAHLLDTFDDGTLDPSSSLNTHVRGDKWSIHIEARLRAERDFLLGVLNSVSDQAERNNFADGNEVSKAIRHALVEYQAMSQKMRDEARGG